MVERVALLGVVERPGDRVGGEVEGSFPDASSSLMAASFENDQHVAFLDGLALLALDLRDGAVVLRLHRHLHLHRLEDHHRVAVGDSAPTSASIFQTVPVMCASMSAIRCVVLLSTVDRRLNNGAAPLRPSGSASHAAE